MADETLPLFPLEDWKKYRIRTRGWGTQTRRKPGPRVTICTICGVAYYPYHKRQYACSSHCSLVVTFWKNVEKTEQCWIWQGQMTNTGYGNMGTRTHGHILVHRFSYELHKGPIPEGLVIDHLCRNRPCVNPAHLEAVTYQENYVRAVPTATHCKRGHAFDEANTYWQQTKDGRERVCRACKTWHARKYYAAAKKQRE